MESVYPVGGPRVAFSEGNEFCVLRASRPDEVAPVEA